jgi:hypothetical protein
MLRMVCGMESFGRFRFLVVTDGDLMECLKSVLEDGGGPHGAADYCLHHEPHMT